MYKPFLLNSSGQNEGVPVRKTGKLGQGAFLPELPLFAETIKDPIDPNFNDLFLISKELETELLKFESLRSLNGENPVLVHKSWFLEWKNYVHGGKFPGVIRTSGILDSFSRPKPKSYIKISTDQYLFLKSIYTSEERVEYSSLSKVKRPKSRNLSISVELKDLENEESDELVTLMDENFCKTLNQKNSETETLPELCLKFGKQRIGFENPAFFCYLNSTLQCLLSIPEIINFFLSLTSPPDPKLHCFTYHVYSIVYAVLNEKSKTIRPVALWKEVGKHFSPALQHDFFDFWRFLIGNIEKENSKEGIINELFKGRMHSKLVCRACHKESITIEDFYDISLEFAESLKKGVSKFLQAEKIRCFCGSCKSKTKHFKSLTIDQAPKVLVVQVKRFKAGTRPLKIGEPCKFHKQLKLKTLHTEEKFSLISIAEHKGSMNYGHYNAYCKRYTKWFKFNDSKVFKIPLARVLKKPLYCAIYERRLDVF